MTIITVGQHTKLHFSFLLQQLKNSDIQNETNPGNATYQNFHYIAIKLEKLHFF